MRTKGRRKIEAPKVFMMDLWATVPYYTAYLSRALQALGVRVQIGSITYYLDRGCFRSRNLRLQPGLLDVAGWLDLPRAPRRLLKLTEGAVNLLALSLRFLWKPPDVLHIQFLPLLRSRLPLDLWFVRFCARRGSHTVLTVHDLLPHDTGEQHKALYRHLYAAMDRLICHSAHIQSRLTAEFGVPVHKISVIPHGPFFYDLPEADAHDELRRIGLLPGQPIVLWQGILFPYKGVDLLLNAWQEIEQQSELTLVVLGTGDSILTASLVEQARMLGLKRVHFEFRFCSTEELVAAYRAARVVVYPYRAITTSGALATGLALSKAIVAADLPVFRELLVDGKNALLVNPSVREELAAAVLQLAQNDALRETLTGNVCAMHFGDNSWLEIAAKTSEVYRSLLEQVL